MQSSVITPRTTVLIRNLPSHPSSRVGPCWVCKVTQGELGPYRGMYLPFLEPQSINREPFIEEWLGRCCQIEGNWPEKTTSGASLPHFRGSSFTTAFRLPDLQVVQESGTTAWQMPQQIRSFPSPLRRCREVPCFHLH